MIPKSNLHTHTTYCDGAASPRDIAEEAVRLGMESIGFSGHSLMLFLADECVTDDYEAFWMRDTDAYFREISALKAEFADKIAIFCGIEYDLFSRVNTSRFDYVIGALHYVKSGGMYLSVDESEAVLSRCAKEHFGGDMLSFAEAYFAQYERLVAMQPDIIAHFDLVAKYNEGGKMFDEGDPRYIAAGNAALDKLRESGAFLEINTGAMSRKTRSIPYPAPQFLTYWRQLGGEIVISSDSHRLDTLLFGFEDAVETAKACGFERVKVLTPQGFRDFKI